MARGTDYQNQIEQSLALAENLAGLSDGLIIPAAHEIPGHSLAPNAALIDALLAINATLTALVAAVQENTLGTYEASGRF